MGEDEDGSYIELELDTELPPTCYDDDEELEQDEQYYQLRISISSNICVSLPEVQKESTSADSCEPKVDEIGAPCLPRGLWEIPQHDHGKTTILGTSTTPVIPYVSSRKQPSSTTTTTTGIVMKLLIKFRGTKFGALFESFIKPGQTCEVNNVHKSSKKSKTKSQCYDQIGRRDQAKRSKRCCRVMERDLRSLRGVFKFNAMTITSIGQIVSCSSKRSTSCNTSPIHDDDDDDDDDDGGFSSLCSHHDNSIQAAISHCKSSLGQTSDFAFTSSISSTPSRFVA